MSKQDIPEPERVLELSPNIAIWRVHLDRLRERDVNARVMDDDKFRRLTENIRAEKGLESLPLVCKSKTREGEFTIISGHHRIRACRQAKILVIPVMVIERELTEDEITSKQLAHNSLEGRDDKEVLKQLYESIQDMNQRLASGVSELELSPEMPSISAYDVSVSFDYEPVYILFMSKYKKDFDKALDEVEDKTAGKYLASMQDFEEFSKAVRRVANFEDVRNIAGIMSYMCKLARERIVELEEEQKKMPKGKDEK